MPPVPVQTPEEWASLAGIAHHYLAATRWAEEYARDDHSEAVEEIRRDRELCERIIAWAA